MKNLSITALLAFALVAGESYGSDSEINLSIEQAGMIRAFAFLTGPLSGDPSNPRGSGTGGLGELVDEDFAESGFAAASAFNQFGTARSEATFGVLRVLSIAGLESSATAIASFEDTVSLILRTSPFDPAPTEPATLQYRVRLTGRLNTSANIFDSSAVVSFGLNVGDTATTREFRPEVLGEQLVIDEVVLSDPVPLVYETQNDISLSADVAAFADNAAQAFFDNTVRFEGVVVKDALGNVLEDFSLSSASGTDYTRVVPEACGLVLLAVGCLVAAMTSRSKRLPVYCLAVVSLTSNSYAIVGRHDLEPSAYRSHAQNFPATVALRSPGFFSHCSGTLIAPNWVLTAAHCVDEFDSNGINASVGDLVQNGSTSITGEQASIASVTIADGWDPNFALPSFNNTGSFHTATDIALVELSRPLMAHPAVRSNISSQQLVHGAPGLALLDVVGYGDIGSGVVGSASNTNGEKRGGQNYASSTANEPSSPFGSDWSQHLIVLDFDRPGVANNSITSLEATPAGGDSGGSYYSNGTLAAVHSFSSGGNTYGGFDGATAVSRYNDWINQTMGGVNWNARTTFGSTSFFAPEAWGDGLIPQQDDDVRFSLPYVLPLVHGYVSIDLSFDKTVRDAFVEHGPHGFRSTNGSRLTTRRTTVDDGGELSWDGGILKNTDLRLGYEASGRLRLLSGVISTDNNLEVGWDGQGTLAQEDGEVIAANTYVGLNAGSNGNYVLEGGSLASNLISIGQWGTSQGELLLSEGGSITGGLLFVGAHGTGTVDQEGGNVQVDVVAVGRRSQGDGVYRLRGGAVEAQLEIGYEDTAVGRFVMTGGEVMAPRVFAGVESGSTGTLEIGAGTVSVSDVLYAGYGGGGEVIQSGGSVTAQTLTVGRLEGGDGTYRMSGGDLSAAVRVGLSGTGRYVMTAGSVSSELFELGGGADGIGTLQLSGGSFAAHTSGSHFIGRNGSGVLDITGGVFDIQQGSLYLGDQVGADGRATVQGGSLAVSSADRGLYVGARGNGVLQVGSDGEIVVEVLSVGLEATGTGEVIQTGGNVAIGGELAVGGLGQGTYRMQGGTLNLAGNLLVSKHTGAEGNLEQTGGEIRVAGDVEIPLDATGYQHLIRGGSLSVGGTLHADQSTVIDGGSVVARRLSGVPTFSSGYLEVESFSSLLGDPVPGEIQNTGSGTFALRLLGAGPDCSECDRQLDYAQGSNATLEVGLLIDNDSGEVLGVDGGFTSSSAELGGRLRVIPVSNYANPGEDPLIDGFTNPNGIIADPYRILPVISSGESGIVGGFSTLEGPGVPLLFSADALDSTQLFRWELIANEQTAGLVVVPMLDGDFNADGAVDAADYTVWRDLAGTEYSTHPDAVYGPGDANLDLVVDELDYQLWVSNFGMTLADLPLAASVPEPSAVVLVLLTSMLPLASSRRVAS